MIDPWDQDETDALIAQAASDAVNAAVGNSLDEIDAVQQAVSALVLKLSKLVPPNIAVSLITTIAVDAALAQGPR